ncbi:MAG: WG repeat-containing protein [Thermoflexibacter sp.]|nr:WG repeat-containing protein [Thermoflexibacter sp.]
MLYLSDKTILEIAPQPFASGGEGELYKIIAPSNLANHVVKIYHAHKRSQERYTKIKNMFAHVPDFHQFGHSAAIWVSEIVYDESGFVGFVMQYAQGIKLEYLCHTKLPKFLGNEWAKYDLKYQEAFYLRLKLCFNIAVAVSQIHATKRYYIGDLKPDNIILKTNGLVSIVDIDSFAIIEGNKTVFPASAQSPEYSPATSNELDENWDRFSLAVIFYRLLFGIHPFTGSCNPPYQDCNSVEDMIKNALFPHNPAKKNYFNMIPPPHAKFTQLDSESRQLFMEALLSEGRPSAERWLASLHPYSKMVINVPVIIIEENPIVSKPNTSTRKRVNIIDLERKKHLDTRSNTTGTITGSLFKFITWGINVFAFLFLLLMGIGAWSSLSLDGNKDSHIILVDMNTMPSSWSNQLQLYYDKHHKFYILKNIRGKELAVYDDVQYSAQGSFVKVWQGGEIGFIDNQGREVTPCKHSIFEPLFPMRDWDTDQYGFINEDGKQIITATYDSVGSFKHIYSTNYADYAKIWQNDKVGLIDKNGKLVLPCIYDKIVEIDLTKVTTIFEGKIKIENL